MRFQMNRKEDKVSGYGDAKKFIQNPGGVRTPTHCTCMQAPMLSAVTASGFNR